MEENNKTNYQPTENSSDIQISDIISWTFSHKLFITLSVIVCLLLATVYIYRSPSVYKRESSVMIRSNSNGQSQIGELAAFEDLGMFNTGLDVYNEIEAFRSPILMEEVVERLGLNTTYTSKNWIGRQTDWYGQAPISVIFSNCPEKIDGKKVSSFSFKVRREDQTLVLSDFKANGKDIDCEHISTKLSVTQKTPVGDITTNPTLLDDDNFASPIDVSHAQTAATAKSYLNSLTAELADKKGTVINFSITDTSEKRAEDILNTLLDVYNGDWIEYMSQSSLNTSKFINERLVVIEKELGIVDTDIEKFKSQNKLLDITAETAQVTEESSRYSSEAFNMNNQLSIAKFIREYLVDQTKAFELLPSNSGIENDNVESLIAEYNKLLLERQRFVDNSSNNNPLVNDLNKQLTLMRATILQSVDNLINTLKIQVDHLAAQENKISNRITENPGKVRELLSIERQQKIKEELYLYLLQKREENELSSNIVVNNTRLLKPASGDSTPISPKKTIILAVALLLGLAIPYGYMFLMNMMDTTVRGRKDIEHLPAPIIGEVPQIGQSGNRFFSKWLSKKQTEEKPKVLVVEHRRDIANEAFRVIRTNLDFILNTASETQILLMTSFNAGSGKTFNTIHIAASQALKGKKVVIVDLDIRKGTLSKFVNSPSKGAATFLNHQALIDNIIIKNAGGIENLDIIPTGTLPPNPSELLLDKKLEELAAELKKRYDYVLLDCPPAGIIADASIIARIADRTVFAIRVGLLDRRILPDIEELYNTRQFPNMMLLLNGCKQSAGYGYSQYGYGYGRYSYGNEE